MNDGFLPLKDPNWGETNIWGTTPETEAMHWYEKYTYLKKTFAPSGVLIAHHHSRKYEQFALGDDAQRIFDVCHSAYLKLENSRYGVVVRDLGQPGYISGELQEHGIAVYQYSVGTFRCNLHDEMWGVDDFLDELDGITKSSPVPRDITNESFSQLSLFDMESLQ